LKTFALQVLLAGIAGAAAGAISMAMSEFIGASGRWFPSACAASAVGGSSSSDDSSI
jgi:hypothetical protein